MPQHHLNYFFPYTGDVSHFETSLTRAFFALVNLCPVVHAQLLNMVREQVKDFPSFFDLHEHSFNLEASEITSSQEDAPTYLVHLTGVSSAGKATITKADSERRYDAIIEYETGMRLVFESKKGAANQKDSTIGKTHKFEEQIIHLRWNDLVEAISRLIESKMLRGTDEELAKQFVAYVEMKFPRLCPYSTLARCQRNPIRVQEFCLQLLRSIGGTTEGKKIDFGQGEIARFGFLKYDDDKKVISLYLYPADTVGQARKFYKQEFVEQTLALQDKGWFLDANLHLAFMQKNYVWTAVMIPLGDYLQYWLKRISTLTAVKAADRKKNEFVSAFNVLVEAKMADEADRKDFIRYFMETNRTTMNICPGLAVKFDWSLDEAEKLDAAEGGFLAVVRNRLAEGLAAWGAEIKVQDPSVMEQKVHSL